jgi:hypothetical protein
VFVGLPLPAARRRLRLAAPNGPSRHAADCGASGPLSHVPASREPASRSCTRSLASRIAGTSSSARLASSASTRSWLDRRGLRRQRRQQGHEAIVATGPKILRRVPKGMQIGEAHRLPRSSLNLRMIRVAAQPLSIRATVRPQAPAQPQPGPGGPERRRPGERHPRSARPWPALRGPGRMMVRRGR